MMNNLKIVEWNYPEYAIFEDPDTGKKYRAKGLLVTDIDFGDIEQTNDRYTDGFITLKASFDYE